MTDDTGLIDRASRGEQRAFRELYDRHVDPLYRFLRQYSDESAQVEEWVQRAFIKAFGGIGSFQRASRFSTWLFTIGLNEMRSDLRRPAVVTFDSREVESWDGREEPGDFLEHEAVRHAVRELDEAKRSVFLLYEVEGYSHGEIAGMLGIGEGTSRALLSRAKQALRKTLHIKEIIA
jgi:RNA polymerase sigma-70 factor (ECF subfamily)